MKLLVCVVLFGVTRAHVAHWNHLHPVQGLYVKPSTDGTTGDLYVAATEDGGMQSQWLTDQPVNFLASATQPMQATALPMTYSASMTAATSPHDESIMTTQKRAVVTQPMMYSYGSAVPMPAGNEVTNGMSYPYGMMAPAVAAPTEGIPVQAAPVQPQFQYSPMQFFYPSFMSAASKAMTALKDSGANEENQISNTYAPQHSMWPTAAAYAYPTVQYVMMDPNAWAASQAAAAMPTAAAPNAAANEAPKKTA